MASELEKANRLRERADQAAERAAAEQGAARRAAEDLARRLDQLEGQLRRSPATVPASEVAAAQSESTTDAPSAR